MNYLLRPRMWPSFPASSGVGPCDVPLRYARNQSRDAAGRLPGGTTIFFALAALRSVPQAGSQFRGLTTAIHEISGLAGPVSLCCPLSFGPAQDRSYDALWILLFFVGLRTTIRFELLHAATSLNSFLEALLQVVTMAAVFLRLDDAVLISGHTVFRNAKARRPAIRHILHSKGRESAHQVKLNRQRLF